MSNKKKVFMLTGIFTCLSVLCFCMVLIFNVGNADVANAAGDNNQSYKRDLPKNSEEVYSGKFAIDSDDEKAVAAYIEHCMDVVASDSNSKKVKNLTSLSSNRLDEFLYYKITDEQNSKYALHIARTDKGGYTQFSSDTVPWYDQRYSFYSVVVEDEIYPKSTAAWFGCINDDITGNVTLSKVQSFIGMNKIHLSTDASFMFTGCVFGDLGGSIDGLPQGLENVILADSMFDYTKFPDDLLQSAIYGLKNATNRYYCFANNPQLTKAIIDTDNNVENQTVNFSYMFRGDSNLTAVEGIPNKLKSDSSFKGMFRLCSNLTKIYAEQGTNWTGSENSTYMFDGCNALIGGCGSNISSGEITGVCAKTDGGRGDEGYFTVKNVPDEAVADGEANGGRVSVDPSNNGNNFNTDQGTFKVNSANPNQICFYIDGDAASEKQSSKTHTVTATQEFSYEYKWVYSYNGRDWFDIDNEDYYPVKDSGVTVKAVFKTKTVKTVKIPSWKGNIVYDGTEHNVSNDTDLYWDDFDEQLMSISGDIKQTNAGEYSASFILTDKNNYKWENGSTEPQAVKWKIDKADWKVDPYPKGQALRYTGAPQELLQELGSCVDELGHKQKIYYALGTKESANEDYNRVKNPTAIDNDVYFIWYQVKEDNNHNEYTCKPNTLPRDGGPAIAAIYKDSDKRVRIITPPEGKELYYPSDEDLATPGECVFGEMQYALGSKDRMPDISEFSSKIPPATNHLPGTYYIWYYAKHNDAFPNFADSEFGYVESIIHHGQAEVVQPPTPYTLEYNCSPQTIAGEGIARGGTMLYAVTDSKTAPATSEYHTAIEQRVNAGTYYIYYYVKGSEGYKDSPADYVVAEITKPNLEITIDGHSGYATYDGYKHSHYGYFASAESVPYYSESKIICHVDAYCEGVDVGTYWEGLEAKYFEYDDKNVNAIFNVNDGCLIITKGFLTVGITGDSDAVFYDGNFHTVEGYRASELQPTSIINFDPNLVNYNGNTKIEERNASRNGNSIIPYEIELLSENFSYDNDNVDATFIIHQNISLTIYPVRITVDINGNSDTVVYDGHEHTVQGYNATSDNDLFDPNKLKYSGADSITQTDVNYVDGAVLPYTLALDKNAFSYEDDSIDLYIYNAYYMQPISLTILQAEFTDIVKPTPYRGAYHGETDLLTSDGSFNPTNEGVMQYGLGTAVAKPIDSNYSTEHPKANAAGVYYIWFRIVANTHNYKDYVSDEPVIAIIEAESQQAQIIVPPTGKTITYGTEETLASQGAAVFGEMLYAISTSPTEAPADNEFSEAIPTGLERMNGNEKIWRDHGTYYIWYYAKGTDGHDDSAKANVESKITPAQIDIAICGDVDACQYDGNYHTVSGYSIRTTSNLFKEDYFSTDYRNEELTIVEKDVNYVEGAVLPYDKILDETKFHYSDPSGNVVVNNQPGHGIVIEGDISLTIYPTTLNITVYGNIETIVYDTQWHTVSGYELECDNNMFDESYVTYISGIPVRGRDVGTYTAYLNYSSFVYNDPNAGHNIKANFVIARYMYLTITPAIMEIVVNGNTAVESYTGGLLVSEGYNATSLNPAFNSACVVYAGLPIASGIEIGVHTTRLDKVLFRYDDPNVIANFTVALPVSLTILPAHVDINITGNSETCSYDGSRHMVLGYNYELAPDSPNVLLPAIAYLGIAEVSGVDVGTYTMGLDPVRFISINPNIVCTFHIVHDGELMIEPAVARINVMGNSTITTYNGHEQTSEGYTVTSDCAAVRLDEVRYSGDASVSATDVNIVNDRIEPYYMHLDASQFSYNDPNIEASFNISSDGSLLIQKGTWIIDTVPVGCHEKASIDGSVPINLITEKGKCKPYSDANETSDINIYCEGTLLAPNNQWSEVIPTETLPGEYFVWYKIPADNDHNEYTCMVPVKAVLTVNNDAYVTVPPTPITIPYSSSDPMCTEGVCERGQLKYAVTPKDVETPPDKSEFDTSVPTGETDSGFRDAGEYRIWYYVEASEGYEDSEFQYIITEITKIKAEFCNYPRVEAFHYYKNGTAHFIKEPGYGRDDLPCVYAIKKIPSVNEYDPADIQPEDWIYNYRDVTADEVGYYRVYYIIKGDKNHWDSDIKGTTCQIFLDKNREIIPSKHDLNLIVKNYTSETIYFDYRRKDYLPGDYISVIVDDLNICNASADFEDGRIKLTVNAVAGGSTKVRIILSNNCAVNTYSEDVNVNVDFFTYSLSISENTDLNENTAKVIRYVGAYNYSSPEDTISVPEQIKLQDGSVYKVVSIGSGTHFDPIMNSKYAEYISLNSNITSINHSAFFGSHIVSVSNTSSITKISQMAFEFCSSLAQFGDVYGAITISSNVDNIGSYAFAECTSAQLTKIDMSKANNLTTLKGDTFYCGSNPFKYTSIKINERLTYVSYYDFAYTKEPESNNLIYDDDYTAILCMRENGCYTQDKFEISNNFDLHKNVRLVAECVLSDSANLRKVVIDKPGNFQIYINGEAFYNCPKLETFFVKDSKIVYGDNVLNFSGSQLYNGQDLVFGGNLDGDNVNVPTGTPSAPYVKLQQKEYTTNYHQLENKYYWLAQETILDHYLEDPMDGPFAFDLCGYNLIGYGELFYISGYRDFYLLDTGDNASTDRGARIDNRESYSNSAIHQPTNYAHASIKIYDCAFKDCHKCPRDSTGGGAINLATSKLYMFHGYFDNNFVYYTNQQQDLKGGAIYIDPQNEFTPELHNCTFINNHVYAKGSGLKALGGAIYCQSISLDNCTFDHNCSMDEDSPMDYGGAIYLNSSSLNGAGNQSTMVNCTFKNNHAVHGGGAIYAAPGTKFSVANSTFDKNTCTENGGAIDMNGKDESASISGCTFSSNSAGEGGAIHVTKEAQFSIDGSHFSDNSTKDKNGNGGAIFISDTQWNNSVTNSDFTNNSAKNGGAFYSYEGYLTFKDSNFTSNTCKEEGGAVDIVHCDDHSIKFNECKFNNNSSDDEGGAVEIQGAKSNGPTHGFYDCKFNSNSAKDEGGAVYVDDESNWQTIVAFHRCDLNYNSAVNNGGAIYDDSAVLIYDSYLSYNYATNGGAIYVHKLHVLKEVKDTTFEYNSADCGGACCICSDLGHGTNSEFEFNNCEFYYNGAKRHGGAILLTSRDDSIHCVLNDCTFKYNAVDGDVNDMTALSSGGAKFTGNLVASDGQILVGKYAT